MISYNSISMQSNNFIYSIMIQSHTLIIKPIHFDNISKTIPSHNTLCAVFFKVRHWDIWNQNIKVVPWSKIASMIGRNTANNWTIHKQCKIHRLRIKEYWRTKTCLSIQIETFLQNKTSFTKQKGKTLRKYKLNTQQKDKTHSEQSKQNKRMN